MCWLDVMSLYKLGGVIRYVNLGTLTNSIHFTDGHIYVLQLLTQGPLKKSQIESWSDVFLQEKEAQVQESGMMRTYCSKSCGFCGAEKGNNTKKVKLWTFGDYLMLDQLILIYYLLLCTIIIVVDVLAILLLWYVLLYQKRYWYYFKNLKLLYWPNCCICFILGECFNSTLYLSCFVINLSGFILLYFVIFRNQ